LSQLRKSYRNELQNTTTHCTRGLTVSESGGPKIWTIVQIFGLVRKARAGGFGSLVCVEAGELAMRTSFAILSQFG
jgi:hypothetical protein